MTDLPINLDRIGSSKETVHKAHGSSADQLLRRRAPEGYLQEWEVFLGSPKEAPATASMSATVIFKICNEFLAISTAVVGQVTELKPIHHVPHQRGKIVRGCVNINGQLRMFVSMTSLLEISSDEKVLDNSQQHSMMVIENESDVWAFAVTEVCGVHHFDMSQLNNVPVNVAKSTANYLKGVFYWNEQSVGYLDDELLFFSLRKCVI